MPSPSVFFPFAKRGALSWSSFFAPLFLLFSSFPHFLRPIFTFFFSAFFFLRQRDSYIYYCNKKLHGNLANSLSFFKVFKFRTDSFFPVEKREHLFHETLLLAGEHGRKGKEEEEGRRGHCRAIPGNPVIFSSFSFAPVAKGKRFE